MKFYPNIEKERESYVVSYEVKGNKINVNMADGEKKVFPYSEATEESILAQMEKQVKNLRIKDEHNITIAKLLDTIGLAFSMAGYVFALTCGSFMKDTLALAIALLCLPVVLYYSRELGDDRIASKKNKDIKRLQFFAENKKILSSKVKDKEKVMNGISRKAVKEIEKEDLISEQPLTLNNIDNISLKDLKTLRDNIQSLNYQKQEEDDLISAIDNAYKVYGLGKKPNNK